VYVAHNNGNTLADGAQAGVCKVLPRAQLPLVLGWVGLLQRIIQRVLALQNLDKFARLMLRNTRAPLGSARPRACEFRPPTAKHTHDIANLEICCGFAVDKFSTCGESFQSK
jgi:hypothetical protein